MLYCPGFELGVGVNCGLGTERCITAVHPRQTKYCYMLAGVIRVSVTCFCEGLVCLVFLEF